MKTRTARRPLPSKSTTTAMMKALKAEGWPTSTPAERNALRREARRLALQVAAVTR